MIIRAHFAGRQSRTRDSGPRSGALLRVVESGVGCARGGDRSLLPAVVSVCVTVVREPTFVGTASVGLAN